MSSQVGIDTLGQAAATAAVAAAAPTAGAVAAPAALTQRGSVPALNKAAAPAGPNSVRQQQVCARMCFVRWCACTQRMGACADVFCVHLLKCWGVCVGCTQRMVRLPCISAQ